MLLHKFSLDQLFCRTTLPLEQTNLTDVDASHLISLGVPVAELCHSGDGVQAGVLGQRGGDHLQGVAVRSHAVGLHASKGAGVLRQTHDELDLWSAATGYQGPEEKMKKLMEHCSNQ